ncbi:hypothetical protein L596_014599 [Steinernema carpocapsae]|nr:hypothetical protein L596_014599 [Steinernema carpocapsae]
MERNRKRRQELEAEEQQRLNAALSEFESEFGPNSPRPNKSFIRGDVVNPAPPNMAPKAPIAFGLKPAGAPTLQKSGLSSSALEQAKKLAQERAKKFLLEAAASRKIDPASTVVAAPPRVNRPPKPGVNGKQTGKSNLEEFREELRQLQEAREQRKGVRQQLQHQLGVDDTAINRIVPLKTFPTGGNGEFDHDPFTTNLYLSNLSLNIEMDDLYKTFGTYGPLASAKILFPRPDEDRRRDYLCGFVAYMSRIDAERAMSAMQRHNLKGNDIKISFAKPVTLPPQPFYVPPALAEFTVPDPPTGLPFNAKADSQDLQDFLQKYGRLPPINLSYIPNHPDFYRDYEKMISRAVVRVVIPTERPLLCLIHRVVEFVVRYGPEFEFFICRKEAANPTYRFLFELHHPAHVYYRWKLFSICQGDSPKAWRTERFRMYQNGSWWDPPPMGNPFLTMPMQLYHTAFLQPVVFEIKEEEETNERKQSYDSNEEPEKKIAKKGELSQGEQRELDDLLADLIPEKKTISDAMVWCIEHAECAKQIVECIYESFLESNTPLHKFIARLYLIVDIISNSAVNVRGAFYYRQYFEERLLSVCSALHRVHSSIESRMKAEQFKQRVMLCFRVWEENSVYPTDVLIKMQNVFLGLYKESDYTQSASKSNEAEDIDGAPLVDDEDIDGAPLDEDGVANVSEPLQKPIFEQNKVQECPSPATKPSVSSKWDMIDEGGVDDDIDGVPMDESMESFGSSDSKELGGLEGSEDRRRQLLRTVELKVIKYQEELEAENSPNIAGLVSNFRSKLMREMEEQLNGGSSSQGGSSQSPDVSPKKERSRKETRRRSRSRSRGRDRSRSRSPRRRRSRSRSRDRERRHSKR